MYVRMYVRWCISTYYCTIYIHNIIHMVSNHAGSKQYDTDFLGKIDKQTTGNVACYLYHVALVIDLICITIYICVSMKHFLLAQENFS